MRNSAKAIFVVLGLLAGAADAATDTFVASGTWTAPAGVTSVDVEVWGGGGAGGGQNQNSDGGGGGGGGAYSKVAGITVIPGNTYSFTVGVGGVGVAGGTGGTGGDSYFINTSTVLAKGGVGGAPSTGTPPAGGAGGAAASGVGTTRFSGGNGGKGRNSNTGQGGPGGSSAGTAANGTSGPTTWSTLAAAAPPTGGGIGGNGGDVGNDGFVPASGNGGGGGGSGDGTAMTGGNGADGKINITYALAPTVTTNAATAFTTTGATLNGTVSSNGASTTVTFDYGLTTGYGSSATATGSPLAANATNTAISAAVTGLTCGTTYHFRAKGANVSGTTNGGDLTFNTSACPPPFCSQPSNTPIDPNTNQPLVLTCQCDTFARATLNPSTIFNSNWTVSTSDATGISPSIVNPGYLRLTNNTNNNAKAATVPGIFPAAGNYISVEFQQYAYNGSGADGIAVTLSDYSVPAVPGAFGGSLGYAQKGYTPISDCTTPGGCPGFAGGWIGVALDEYGGYQYLSEGRIGGTGARVPQSVGVRGSGSGMNGYNYLTGTSTFSAPNTIDNAGSTTPSRGYYYQVIVDARTVASTSVTVNRDTTSGTGASYIQLISIPDVFAAATARGFTQAAVPINWQISFTGSTGGSTNIHEIGGLRICAQTIVPPTGGTASGFSAIDEAYPAAANGIPAYQNFQTGHIFTKLPGAANTFRLWVAALTGTGISSTYSTANAKYAKVNIVDNSDNACGADSSRTCTSTCTNKAAVEAGAAQIVTFVKNGPGASLSPSFTLNSSWKNLIAVIKECTTSTCTAFTATAPACSVDSFSVRPLSIASVASIDTPPGTGNAATNGGSTGSPFFKAGSGNFALTATTSWVSGNPSGYNGVMKINNAVIASTATYAGAVTGTFQVASYPATTPYGPSTATGTTFTYSEVGGLQLPGYTPDATCTVNGSSLTAAQCNLMPRGVYDDTWTGVDSISTKSDCVADSYSNTKDATGKYGCNLGLATTTAVIGRFVPDHFAVSSNLIVNRAEYGIATGSITAGTGTLTLAAAAGVKVGDVISIVGAGVAGTTFSSKASMVSADGLTVTLVANASTTVTNSPVNVVPFTYMGEQMDALFTLTAQAAGNTTTRNYAGSTWAKLDPTVAGALNLGAIDNPVAPGVRVPLTARINTTGLPAATGQFPATCTPPSPACLGIANVIAPFTISRGASGDGPYSALDIGIAPVDSDGVTTIYDLDTTNVGAGVNDHTRVGTTEVRYGRIKVSNAYGSELLPLTLTATAQYYTSTGWTNSTTDNLTNLTLAATYPLLDKNGAPTGSTTSASRSPATGFLAGHLSIRLAQPSGGATLTGIATVNPTNNPAAASTYLPVTPGTATFGVYKGRDSYIYRRESY